MLSSRKSRRPAARPWQFRVTSRTKRRAASFAEATSSGTLKGLVNNAGVVDYSQRVDEMTLERLTRMFSINVIGAFLCAREAVRRMSTKHGGTGGVIVNLGSAASKLGSPSNMSTMQPPRGLSIP